jgi:hypothetical protein
MAVSILTGRQRDLDDLGDARPGRLRRGNNFEVTEDSTDGGYIAAALGYGITTQADTLDQLRKMVKDSVECHFLDAKDHPKIVRLHFVGDEVFAL